VFTPLAPDLITNTASVTATELDPNPTDDSTDRSGNVENLPGIWFVPVTDSGFPVEKVGNLAERFEAIQWNILGPSPNGVEDGTGMGLFSTGLLTPVAYDKIEPPYTAAGKYLVTDALGHSMLVKVPIEVSPSAGTTSTVFSIAWAGDAPKGFVYDVQILRPGAKWHNWLMHQTVGSTAFTPDAGVGYYKFRARMRKTSNQASSDWSAPKTLTAT
jgi:hypothetical protein